MKDGREEDIRRRTRRKYSAEEKIRIVIEGLRGENTVAELCRREGINQNLYYKWSKEFLEAGKQRLAGNTKRQAGSNEVKELRRDMEQLKQLVAELALKNRVLKKNLLGMDTPWNKGSQAEKMEIIHLVEHSDLPITRTLDELDVPRSSFYRWYQKYQEEGYDGLADSMSRPHQFWTASQTSCGNKSSRLRWHMLINHPGNWHGTSPIQKGISSLNRGVCGHRAVRRILKGFDLVASPVFMMVPAKDKVEKPTKRVNELWQTDFTHLKVHGWGWYYLSTVLDDYSRYILAWKLSKTMAAGDVRDTLELALAKTNLERVKVRHHPRLLSDNGPCYVSHELKHYLQQKHIEHIRGAPYHPIARSSAITDR